MSDRRLRAYRRILVPSDGSPRSRRAGRIAARLARSIGARLFALYVAREAVPSAFSGGALYASPALSRRLQAVLRKMARQAVGLIAAEAEREGVRCTMLRGRAARPWQAILRTARARGCDLIVMASHGRGAAASALLGSETTQVLAHSKIPVLVCR